MRLVLALLPIVMWSGLLISTAAQNQQHAFMKHAQVEHQQGRAIVMADDPRPLWQAIVAVREEYGWIVSYEDAPIISPVDLVDNSAPSWRAAHPNEKGYMIPRGREFSSTFSDIGRPLGADGEQQVLQKLIADYNVSGNPGKYRLRKDGPERYFVIAEYANNAGGHEEAVKPVLDTAIFLPSATRSAQETVGVILQELSRASGVEVICTGAPTSTLGRAQVTIGGTAAPARTWLLATFAASGRPMLWDLMFEPNDRHYHINIYIASRAVTGPKGQRWLMPVDASN